TDEIFTVVGKLPFDAVFNLNEAEYKDYDTKLTVRVLAKQQTAPEVTPTFLAYWNDTLSQIELPPEYRFVGGSAGTVLDDNFLLQWFENNGLAGNEIEYPIDVTFYMAYNTDKQNFADYYFDATVTIDKRLSSFDDVELPKLEGDLDKPLSSVGLPEGFVWQNPDFVMDNQFRGGSKGDRTGEATALYLQDNDALHYQSVEVALKIRVTSLSDKIDNLLGNPWIFIGSAVGAGFVIFLIFFLIARSGKKPKPVAEVPVPARPGSARPGVVGQVPKQVGYGQTQYAGQLPQGQGRAPYPQTQMAPRAQQNGRPAPQGGQMPPRRPPVQGGRPIQGVPQGAQGGRPMQGVPPQGAQRPPQYRNPNNR
ncbi:MAG: hypothetical protein FWD76_06255, partial [Firmicutes bacterium]|nr:hypothetical protein [Bacillota bacterium]